ncbi:hypothetical protein GQ53DRAFT_743407, partial [Thozetella sp. PMI_491]
MVVSNSGWEQWLTAAVWIRVSSLAAVSIIWAVHGGFQGHIKSHSLVSITKQRTYQSVYSWSRLIADIESEDLTSATAVWRIPAGILIVITPDPASGGA